MTRVQSASMRLVWCLIKTRGTLQAGFSTIELLLACAIFTIFVTGIGGAIVYGRSASAGAGNRIRANLIAEEGVEAVRNYRNAAYTNLVDGTYGLVQTGGVWTLSGSSDTTGIYTRSVTIATTSLNRRLITSHVTWANGGTTSSVDVVGELTNWLANLSLPIKGGLDLSGTNDGLKVATKGNYAYLVRNDGTPDFAIIDISNPASPTLVGSLSLAGAPTNIAVNGNYAYVSTTSDTGELQIINIATPTAPVLAGTYDAPGTADAYGVAVTGNTVVLSRLANGGTNELLVLNAATPTAVTVAASYGNNVNMREVYVNGTVAYVTTDTGLVLVVNFALAPIITLASNIAVPGTGSALTIAGSGTNLFVGRGTTFSAINAVNLVGPAVYSSVVLPGAINDISLDTTNGYAYVGTSYTAGELQTVNIGTLTSLTLSTQADVTGTTSSLYGVAYSPSLNVVAGASASDTQELVVIGGK